MNVCEPRDHMRWICAGSCANRCHNSLLHHIHSTLVCCKLPAMYVKMLYVVFLFSYYILGQSARMQGHWVHVRKHLSFLVGALNHWVSHFSWQGKWVSSWVSFHLILFPAYLYVCSLEQRLGCSLLIEVSNGNWALDFLTIELGMFYNNWMRWMNFM